MDPTTFMGSYIFVFIILGFALLASIVGLFSRIGKASGVVDQSKKFVALGNVKGKSLKEIVDKVGPPTSISAAKGGAVLYQWMKVGPGAHYHYGILFKDDVCVGYTHQSVSR